MANQISTALQTQKLARVLLALGPGWESTGNFTAVVNGAPFPKFSYRTASAIYECARRFGANAALVYEDGNELIRRTWGFRVA